MAMDPQWYRALHLAERTQALRASQGRTSEVDGERAERRLARWRSQKGFAVAGRFERRLAAEGVEEAELRQLLGESSEGLAARHPEPPPWLRRVLEALAEPGDEATELPPEDFTWLVAPLVRAARTRLHGQARELAGRYAQAPFNPERVDGLFAAAAWWRLQELLNRTLVLELNVARLQGQLEGDTSEERYRSFLRRLDRPEVAVALLREYPVLARLAQEQLDSWVHNHLELLRRLCEDREALHELFGLPLEPDSLEAVRSNLGDPHRGGRSVCVLHFRSGLRLVYKPKPLEVDMHFQELLSWANARGWEPALRPLRLLPREGYGWAEYAGHQECHSVEQVQRFYQRQGGLLALLHMLLSTDMHFENVIAMGEHPAFIDLESLFHAHFVEPQPRQALAQAHALASTSVMRVGLLPQRSWATPEAEGVDYSGLGARPGQLSPRPAHTWEGLKTDEARATRRRLEVASDGAHRPRLVGQEMELREYRGHVQEGFARMYRLLVRHREELLAPQGPLARFAEDEVRIIVRPTHLYSLMLREASHPDFLRDALDREAFFDRLWAHVDDIPYLARLIPYERVDLWRGDIPVFNTQPSAREVCTTGGERLGDYLPRSGMELVRQRLEHMGEEDLRRQQWFIDAAFATMDKGQGSPEPYLPATASAPLERAQVLRAARAVGERLEALALRGEGDAAWVGMVAVWEHQWSPRPLGLDLYGGLPGVALFLAWLGELTGEEQPTALARAALRSVQQRLEQGPALASLGGFGEGGGLVYALTHLGALWGEPALVEQAQQVAERLEPLIAKDEQLDVMSGVAGCLVALLGLEACRPSARLRELAVACGERLLEKAQRLGPGLGWATPLARRALTGLSHGAAGMAWALAMLAARTGEARFHEAALGALAWERGQFVPEASNWRDLRQGEGATAFMSAWCHGAPGIGLGRLGMLEWVDTPEVRADIAAALAHTQAHGFGGSHCLCHGDLGNLELLQQAAARLGEPGLTLRAGELAARVLESLEQGGWRCGVPLGLESPGLMNGLAGIGYGLLRLAAPERVPCVLLLEPPRQRD